MTLALRTWWRRGSARTAFPAMVLVDLLALFSRSGWNHEWDWAFNLAGTGTLLVGPLVAGAVAHDRGRRMEPTLATLGAASTRGRQATYALVVSSAGWGVLAWLVTVAVAGTRSALGGAAGRPDVWIFVETPVLLLTAACTGLVVGSLVRGVVAGPVAAVAVFLARIVLGSLSLGLEGAFSVGGATGTLVAVQRSPHSALAGIGWHLSVAGLCLVGASAAGHARAGRTLPRMAALATAAVVVLAASTALRSVAHSEDPFRWSTGPVLCRTGRVTVCGPAPARWLLTVSQRSLTSAVTALSDSGVDWQRRYVLLHGGRLPPDRGTLEAQPEDVHRGRLSEVDVIATLTAPRLCRDLYDDAAALPVLADQQVVRDWLADRLGADPSHGPAPAAVRTAYGRLRSCDPMTAPLP